MLVSLLTYNVFKYSFTQKEGHSAYTINFSFGTKLHIVYVKHAQK